VRSFRGSKRTKRPRAQVAFFSRAEKNQKGQRRGEKLYGEDARAAAERQNSLRSDTAAPGRRSFATASPAFLRAPSHPDGSGELKLAHRTTGM